MRFSENMLELAAQRRRKLFDRLGGDVGVVVALDPANKAYLSGYSSMTHDVAPGYQSAAVATRDGVTLVLGAGDAGPALELLGDPLRFFRYGTFFYEAARNSVGLGKDSPTFATFPEALAAAVAAAAPTGGLFAVDRSDTVAQWLDQYRWRSADDGFATSRATKLSGEIERMQAATRLAEEGIKLVAAQARAGSSEWELAALISHAMARGGAIPRFVVVTSGPRSALADAYPTDRRIEEGDLVRIDIGCSVEGYWTDIARTMVVGEPSRQVMKRYAAIEAGLDAELAALGVGVRAADLFDTAVAAVRDAGIATYQRHHCGHGIGLAGYEFPLIQPAGAAVLEAGMCLCVETPFYEIGWGGMMVEDLVVVDENGYRSLSTLDRSLTVIGA